MEGKEKALKVLVADDDAIQRSLVKSRLAKLNAKTVEAEDGNIAWQLLVAGHFDLAIVDIGMPNFDGIELTRCIRGHPRTRHIPVIVITSRDDRAAIDSAFAAGASSFLVKPVVWSTFEHHIGFLLRLVDSARKTGSGRQIDTATHRAKEMVLGNLCADAASTAQSILQQVSVLHQTYAGSDSDSAVHKRLSRITEECNALLTQSENALVTIEVLAENIRVDDAQVSLNEIIDRVTTAVQPQAQHSHVDIKVSSAKTRVTLSCDADSVVLALTHLVQNAIQHSPAGAKVLIDAKCYPDGLLGIEVVDSGSGMHPNDVARLSSPLRWELEAGEGPGRVGIGLPLAKAVAEAHAGRLEFRSMPGQGTSALFTLPPDRIGNFIAAA